MNDIELYQQILGLAATWSVKGVNLDAAAQKVVIEVCHGEDCRWRCPQCQTECPTYDHSDERTWRHLDTCQFQTFLRARIPRVNCPEHGVVQVGVPWAEPLGRFTMLFERFAIQVLLQCQTTQGACALLAITWDEAQAIRNRAVNRGQSRKAATVVPRIGIDEKAFKRGHSYMTVVCDIDQGVVEFVSEDRTKASLQAYFDSRTPEQRKGIKESLRDLWHHGRAPAARQFFGRWYNWAIRSRLEPVKEVARMIHRKLENIVSYCRHRITNAVAEGLNSKIMSLKRRASGFRNPESFKTAIYFYCGGLDMDPR